MGGNQFEVAGDKGDAGSMNEMITCNVLQAAVDCGVRDFVICPGGRNSSFIDVLRTEKRVSTYYWPEERSAAFFGLGRSRLIKRPVAIVTTSGTAAGELLPAAMEAFYSGVPLMLITVDRPRRFRGSGGPQAAEQVGLFGHYAKFALDVHGDHFSDFSKWTQRGPAHINVCLEEPQGQPPYSGKGLRIEPWVYKERYVERDNSASILDQFLQKLQRILVVVSSLEPHAKEEVAKFLLKLNAPVYLEGISGLREDPRLQPLRIRKTEKILKSAEKAGYPLEGVLRIGGVPTNRIWRDIENLKNHIKACSITELPFSGLSWNRNVINGPIDIFLKGYHLEKSFDLTAAKQWLTDDRLFTQELLELFTEEPTAEPSLMHRLSKLMPVNGHIFLGNSLPIREWDLAADTEDRGLALMASRGLNGIDGQIATFLGLCQLAKENWAILGDLTTLYDMAGFWILPQLGDISASVAIINNGGGKIFERMFPHKETLNCHSIKFEPLATLWGLTYECWETAPKDLPNAKRCLVELIPDENATTRFWKKLEKINSKVAVEI